MIKIDYSLEVEQAIKNNDPLVALESTIITHGMPWPENLKTAKSVETVVREYGATPATIAVINGVIKVGLEDETLKVHVNYPQPKPQVASRCRRPERLFS